MDESLPNAGERLYPGGIVNYPCRASSVRKMIGLSSIIISIIHICLSVKGTIRHACMSIRRERLSAHCFLLSSTDTRHRCYIRWPASRPVTHANGAAIPFLLTRHPYAAVTIVATASQEAELFRTTDAKEEYLRHASFQRALFSISYQSIYAQAF